MQGKKVIRHGEVGMGEFVLSLIEHVNILGDALGISVVAKHVCGEADKFAWVEAATVGIKVVEQLFCGDMGVEGVGMAKVSVPDFFNVVVDELGSGAFCDLVGGEVADKDCMLGFMTGRDNSGGIVVDGRVCRWLDRNGKWSTPGGCV